MVLIKYWLDKQIFMYSLGSRLLPLIIFIILVCPGKCGDIVSARDGLETLLETESVLLNSLQTYIYYQEERLRLLKKSYDDYHSEYKVAQNDIANYLSNPINALKLIKRLHKDWKHTEEIILKDGADFAKSMSDIRNVSIFPDSEDLTGAAEALMRLQNVYQLEAADISDGILNGKKVCSPMTVDECLELGRQACNLNFYTHASKWMSIALSKCEAQHNETVRKAVILDYLGYLYYMMGNITTAINITRELLLLTPDDQKNVQNLAYYESLKQKVEVGEKEEVVSHEVVRPFYQNYEELCRGDLDLPEVVKKHLKCRYLSEKSPFLRLARVKVEEYYLDPYVALFHDVISEREINTIIEIAKPKIKTAMVLIDSGDVDFKLKYAKSKLRVSKSGWLKDDEHEIIQKISRRITDVTGFSMESAELLQVANYGIGGHYEPHYDFSTKDDIHGLHFGKDPNGNRIATLMFYLSDVTLGGYTVFPKIGLAAIPRKGSAIFWLNLRSSGEGDLATYHAACPVLLGSKWVANKWIRQRGQEFRWPCDLKYEPEEIIKNIPEPIMKTNKARKF